MKHHSKPHGDTKGLSIAAVQVLQAERAKLLRQVEEVRLDYERQLVEKAADDWNRCLAMSGLVFRELTGDNKKTERFLMRLAERLQEYRYEEIPTIDIVRELERVTGIELEVQG